MSGEIVEIGVLGAGLCGLMVGEELRRRRVPFSILEKDDEIGGLARTHRFGDVLGDIGPHAIYSRNERVMRFFRSLPVRYDTHRRKVRVVHHGSDGRVHEVDYPFENGIGDLPVADRADCLEGYIEAHAKKRRSFRNLADWIKNGLGFGIGRHFMTPYNDKIWDAPQTRISMGLVKKKIEPAPIRTVVESALGVRTVGRRYQSVFIYPRGGISRLAEGLARRIRGRIVLGAGVRSIRRENGHYSVRTSKGTFRFRRLISTIPLKDFLLRQPYRGLRPCRKALAGNRTIFVGVSLKKGRRFRRFEDCHWLFFAGPEVFYRANMMHVFYRSRRHHLVAEITLKGPLRKASVRALERRTVADLAKVGILGRKADVSSVESRVVDHTYPIPTVDLPPAKSRVERFLAKRGILLVGRSGRWDYLNMDHIVETVWDFFDNLPWKLRGKRR